MKIKALYERKEDIPEGMEELYAEVDGQFVLDVDDGPFKGKLSEFRNNNRQLYSAKQELEERLKQYEGIDPKKYKEAEAALAKLQELEDNQLLDAGKRDEWLAQRTERMRQDYEGRLKAREASIEELTGQVTRFKSRLSDTLIDSTLQSAVTEVAVPRAGAMRDILRRGREIWTVEDEDARLVPIQDGKVIYGSDGEKETSPQEWAASLVREAPFLFESSKGGSSPGSRESGGKSTLPGRITATQIGDNLEGVASGRVVVDS